MEAERKILKFLSEHKKCLQEETSELKDYLERCLDETKNYLQERKSDSVEDYARGLEKIAENILANSILRREKCLKDLENLKNEIFRKNKKNFIDKMFISDIKEANRFIQKAQKARTTQKIE